MSTPPETVATPPGEYAGMLRRLVAALIDGVVLAAPVRLAGWVTGRPGLGTVVWLGYFVVLTALYGQTLGKLATGIKVVRADGSRPDFATAALREVLGKFLSGLVAGIGYLWAIWDERSQGLHDKIAGTVVVPSRPAALEAPGPVAGLWAAPETLLVGGVDVREAIRTSVNRAIRSGAGAIAAAVERERPDLRPQSAPDGTLTILFAEIQDSAELIERLGDQASLDALRAFGSIVADAARANDGFVVKSTGAGVMVTFRSARRALRCALAVRAALAAWAVERATPMQASMGMHTGEVVREGGDFYGRNVVVAARIADAAAGGRILVSSLVRELTESSGEFTFSTGRLVSLKDLSGTFTLYEILA